MKIKKFDSINVVPFIDIMLVLLVIVLTTASFVARGIIPLDLSTSTVATKLKEQRKLTISINKDGELFFNKKNIQKDEINNLLHEYAKDTAININCDKSAKFEYFVYIIDILKDKGYLNLGILTKYE